MGPSRARSACVAAARGRPAVAARSARRPGAAAARDLRCRLADRPRFALRQDPERRRLERGARGAAAEGRRRADRRSSCARSFATCSAASGSRTSRSSGDRRQRSRAAAGPERRDPDSTCAWSGATCSSPTSTPEGRGAAPACETGWKLRSIDGALDRRWSPRCPDAARAALAAASRPGGSAHTRLRGPSARQPRVTFEDGIGRGPHAVRSSAGPKSASRSRSATCRRCSCGSIGPRRDAGADAPAGVIGFNVWMTAVDPLFQQAVDEFRPATGS